MNKKLFFCAVILGIKISAQCNSVNLPYTEDFESVTTPALPSCTTIENAGSGTDWYTNQDTFTGITTKALTYKSNENPANTWFFTPGLNLTAGVEYKVTYKYSGTNFIFPENLKVAYGINANSSSMTNLLADHPDIVNNNISSGNVAFTPTATGVYYIGFNCYSNGYTWLLTLDDINVTTSQLSTAEVIRKNDAVTIYPNPFADVINITKAENIRSVSVTDISGKVVRTIHKPSSQVYLKEFIPGLYMLKMEMKDGSQKVIKAIKK
ncbi:Por secretion system C-terminal sorting domain containing protein [Chryseobacterium populi]|uniref:Por secretion system C-terminal sorting domain containing protein n=2 Tax=Chryseobacterium populi TaxID=1144316 RepID=J2SPN0_9FLAO|nr:Por secretion system C-terminal sorting domain containing protein [Chryseobacterium populi]